MKSLQAHQLEQFSLQPPEMFPCLLCLIFRGMRFSVIVSLLENVVETLWPRLACDGGDKSAFTLHLCYSATICDPVRLQPTASVCLGLRGDGEESQSVAFHFTPDKSTDGSHLKSG